MTTNTQTSSSTEVAVNDALQRAIIALSRLATARTRAEYDQLQLERIQADQAYYAALSRHYETMWGREDKR